VKEREPRYADFLIHGRDLMDLIGLNDGRVIRPHVATAWDVDLAAALPDCEYVGTWYDPTRDRIVVRLWHKDFPPVRRGAPVPIAGELEIHAVTDERLEAVQLEAVRRAFG
jgi:hypothetical protein